MCWKGKDPKSPGKRILCLWVECNFFMQVQRFSFPWALAEFSLWIWAAEPRHGSAITAGRSHYVLPWCHFASPSWSILHILHQLLPHPSRGRTEKDSVQATSHSVTARRQNAGGGGTFLWSVGFPDWTLLGESIRSFEGNSSFPVVLQKLQ